MLRFRFLHRRKIEASFDTLAQEIATASRHRVRGRVEDQCQGMSVYELRGYVRARAGEPIRSRTAQHLHAIAGLSSHDEKIVIQRATERVVQLVVRDLAGMDLAAAPRRKAA
jgi:hypothetical protein